MFPSVFSCSIMGLILTSICVLIGLFSPTARAAGTVPHPHPLLTPDPVTSGQQEQLEAPYLHLPVFRHFRKPRVGKRHFSPASVVNREPMPERVRQVLLPKLRQRTRTRVRPSGPVNVACSAREMRVRVHKASLEASGERVHVRLGTCDASRTTEQSVLFQYELHECGTERQVINETVVYSNTLHYTPEGSVSGSDVFSVPVQCRFNRFHYSYKVGFVPSVERLKFFKPMKSKGSITLTACDEQWNRLSPHEGFVMGKPMYFEAKTLYVPDDERLFVHFCHVTMNSSRDSTPQVKIIDDHGCLIDSKRSSRSRFINSTRKNVVRFSVDAFALQGKVQKYLFIHCEMSIRNVIPTEMSKSCTYNSLEHRWEELYGVDSVCSCCDSSCVPEMPTLMRPLTSELRALVEQHPEERNRSVPTQSMEGIFTPEPEHRILTTESQHTMMVPEKTLILEHEHRTVSPVRTPMPESKHAVPTPESEHGKITRVGTPTPESEHGKITPVGTPTPEGEHGMPTPESEHGKITPVGTPTPEGEHSMPTPESEHGKITPVGTPTPEGEHGMPTPESEHGKITPVGERGTLVPQQEYGTLMLENKHGKVTTETPPMLESEGRMPTSDHEHGTPMPDTNHEKITPYLYEVVSPAPSAEQNTVPPVDKRAELHEPYRIFEEVFGLS